MSMIFEKKILTKCSDMKICRWNHCRGLKIIYKFVGLQLTPEVKEWIKRNTQAQAKSKINPYTTNRDSAATMQAWRNHLSLEQVLTVQNECSEMMKFYGYKKVTNQEELLDLQKILVT